MSENNDKKPKRVLSEEHKEKLAKAREKANEVRMKNMLERREQKKLEITVNELEKKNKIKDLKKKKEQYEKQEEEEEHKNVKNFVEEQEQEQELIYKKKIKEQSKKKKKKKIIYYEESSSSEEEIEYRKRPRPKPIEEKPYSLSNDIIRRQFDNELERSRIQEMIKFLRPQTNWRK